MGNDFQDFCILGEFSSMVGLPTVAIDLGSRKYATQHTGLRSLPISLGSDVILVVPLTVWVSETHFTAVMFHNLALDLLVIYLANSPWGTQRNGSHKPGNKGSEIVI